METMKRTTRASPATTTTTTHVTNAQLKALIDQGVVDALAARDADRSQNGDDSHNSGTGWRLSLISVTMQSRTKLSLNLEMENWKLKVKGTDLASYTQRFQELALMCGRMFLEESDKIKKYVGGLPDMIHGSVMASKPKTGEEAIWGSMPLCSKCNYRHDGLSAPKCRKCNRVGHLARDNKSPTNANTANNQRGTRAGQKATCFECGAQGHFKRECPKLKNNNRGNQGRNDNAPAKVYVVGNAGTNSDSNIITDALSRKERVTPKRVRAMNMTLQSSIKDRILAAQKEASDESARLQKGLDEMIELRNDGALYYLDRIRYGDEHLDTVPATESDEFIKSSVENLVPNPSESEGENKCDVPACFITFSNILFVADYEFDSSDDHSLSDEDFPKEIYSNPLFDEEIIPMKIDPQPFNAESDLIESMLNHDSSIIISSKIDSLFDEFTDELTLLKSIPSGISETDCYHESETHFTKRLLYDNSSPRPPKEFVYDNSNANIESFSSFPIPIKDSDSLMEEIDLSFTPDDPMPSGIEEDDYDSERDIPILEKLLDNYSLSLPKNESYHFYILASSRPPAKPPNGNTGILNIKMMGDISEQKVPIPGLTITRVSNQDKSPNLLPHQGLEIF
uniref:DNA-binding protein HEXBP-like n=1 Tax=Tanacetum cinerariifolium TaxID=118510 RepID=A0A6L2K8W7_TANCI|nr:DNA-binding protein HEXBP-like [Tanacetum cinerariifolium]